MHVVLLFQIKNTKGEVVAQSNVPAHWTVQHTMDIALALIDMGIRVSIDVALHNADGKEVA